MDVLCLYLRTKRWLKQNFHRYRQLETSGYFWEHWWARAVSSYSWRDRHSPQISLPPLSSKHSSNAQDFVTDFDPLECMNYTENQWTIFIEWRFLDISLYLYSLSSTSRTWAPVFLHYFLLSFIQFCWLT